MITRKEVQVEWLGWWVSLLQVKRRRSSCELANPPPIPSKNINRTTCLQLRASQGLSLAQVQETRQTRGLPMQKAGIEVSLLRDYPLGPSKLALAWCQVRVRIM